MRLFCVITGLLAIAAPAFTQTTSPISKVWVADNDDGTCKKPVINSDYSDPDAVRVGEAKNQDLNAVS